MAGSARKASTAINRSGSFGRLSRLVTRRVGLSLSTFGYRLAMRSSQATSASPPTPTPSPRTRQSGASDAHREALGTVAEVGTVLTRAMSGRLARGIANDAVAQIEEPGIAAPFPAQNWLTTHFRIEAARRVRSDLMSL